MRWAGFDRPEQQLASLGRKTLGELALISVSTLTTDPGRRASAASERSLCFAEHDLARLALASDGSEHAYPHAGKARTSARAWLDPALTVTRLRRSSLT